MKTAWIRAPHPPLPVASYGMNNTNNKSSSFSKLLRLGTICYCSILIYLTNSETGTEWLKEKYGKAKRETQIQRNARERKRWQRKSEYVKKRVQGSNRKPEKG